jgi:nitrate/nitrite transporter NarK
MRIGAGIFLLALGGILAFAVSDRISGVDLTVVGYILMAAGALGIVLAIFLSNRGRTTETVVREERLTDPRDPRL